MLQRKPVFPNVIELNHQLGHVLGCNVYLVYDQNEWILIDIGYEDVVDEIIELIRQLDFPFSQCRMLVATHADVDHVQGMAKAKRILRAPLAAHPKTAAMISTGDTIGTFAEIAAQDIQLSMPETDVEIELNNGDQLRVGELSMEVWWTPGHTNNQLSFRFRNLLFCGDTIFRDGCVGAIDAHHGSDLVEFVRSLQRIRDTNVDWLLPSHGPIFRHDRELINATITRLQAYQHMADFGTCALDWPLMDQWEQELVDGNWPTDES